MNTDSDPAQTYDAIVVGGGHNGLTCAAYLARAGRKVVVLEARGIVGGFCTTEENIAEAPGFRMNVCAVDTALTNSPVSVIDELGLHKYGLRFIHPDPWAGFVNPDGASIAFWRDRDRTKQEIARFSRRDADSFERFCATMTDAWWAALPYFQDHPTRPSTKTMGQVLWRLARSRRSLRLAVRIFMNSPEQVIEEYFEREEVKAAFANLGAWSMLPLQEPGSAGVLAMMVAYFRWGVTRPIGGVGHFTEALATCVTDHGGVVSTNSEVEEIVVEDGAAKGVRLKNGRELHARHVIGAIDPKTLMQKLVDQAHVPHQVQAELRGLGVLRWNISVVKADVAISRTPALACGRPELLQGYLLLSPTMDYVKRAQVASMAGELPDEVPMAPMFPSIADPTQVPPGSDGATIYLYMPTVPLELSGGRDWSTVKDGYVKHAMAELDSYAPGVADAVIGTFVKSPKDLAMQSYRGNIIHTDMSIHQMGPWRPVPSMSGYTTQINRLWHTAAGAHPMGALNGWSGRTTARMVHRLMRREDGAVRRTLSAGSR